MINSFTTNSKEIKLLRVKEVSAKCSIGVSSIWRMVKSGNFPKPTRIGLGTTVWHSQHIDDWINEQFDSSLPNKENDK